MIILIAGTTHAGKTAFAQKLMEKYKIPYYSLDHLKMGLIRSGQTNLTTENDEELTPYLWCIAKEIIKTAVENGQSLIVEGCYIPFDWQKGFRPEYLSEIKYYCLVMTAEYVENNFGDIIKFENVIEKRLTKENVNKDELIADNLRNLQLCKEYGLPYILIESDYVAETELEI